MDKDFSPQVDQLLPETEALQQVWNVFAALTQVSRLLKRPGCIWISKERFRRRWRNS
jgi:hypothetical protein